MHLKILANWKAQLLIAGGVLVTAAVVLALYLVDSDDRADASDALISQPASTASAATPPSLPISCGTFIASYHLGTPATGQGQGQAEIRASDCAIEAFADTPAEALGLTIEWRLEPPDGPRELRVTLPAERSADGLAWRGVVTYPQAGIWEPTFRLGAIEERGGYVAVVDDDLQLAQRTRLPLPAMTLPLTVLDTNGDGEAVTWEGAPSNGVGWLGGANEGDTPRAVWVQQRDGTNWVVAGDADTRVVTPLVEVRPSPRLIAAPDGRAVVVIETADSGMPARARLIDAATGTLVDLATDVEAYPDNEPYASWSPDGGSLLLVGDDLRVLNSDGSVRFSSPEGSMPGSHALWAPDSSFALVTLRRIGEHGAPTSRLVRVDLQASTVQTMLDYGNGVEQGFYGDPVAISPDGQQLAFTWVGTTPSRVLHLGVLPADQPFGLDIASEALISTPVPSTPSQQRSWLTAPSWSPDGTQIASVAAGPDRSGDERGVGSRVQVIDTRSGWIRDLVHAPSGYYIGPVSWSADGSTLLALRLNAIQSHGGTSFLDVIDTASGAIVRTVDGGSQLGTAGDEQLLTAPGELLAASAAEPPRTLLDGPRAGGSFTVSPSPDESRLAVLVLPGAVHTVAAGALDGSTQQILGTIERGPGYPAGLRGAEAILAPDSSGAWGWLSLDGSASEPLPLPAGVPSDAFAGRSSSLALSADARQAAYWIWMAADDSLPRLAVADMEAGTAKLIDVPLHRPDAASRGALVWSPDGARVAFLDGPDTLVAIDVASGEVHAVDLAAAGIREAPPLPGVVAFAWDAAGEYIDLVAGRELWRLDLAAGTAATSTAPPRPGGWWGEVVLSRSPDGDSLAAGTPFGVFVQEEDGAWRRISRAGIEGFQPALLWSPDGSQLAYASTGGVGIVVAPLDGSGAYELVTRWRGAELRILSWLPDGRVAYVVLVQGI